MSGWRLKAAVWSVAAAATGYIAFSLWGGWRDVLAAFGAVGMFGMLIALALSLVNFSLRFTRWQLYLSALEHSMPTVPSCLIYIAGFALTTTPGKAGEMRRGVFLKVRGMPYTLNTAASLGERLSDLVAVVLLSLMGVLLYHQGSITVMVGVIGVGIGLLLLSRKHWLMALAERRSQRTGQIARFAHHLLLLLVEACCCHTPRLLLSATVLSLVAWLPGRRRYMQFTWFCTGWERR